MFCFAILIYVACLLNVNGLDNGVALTPPMGWMSWGYYMCADKCTNDQLCLNEELIMNVADSFHNEGFGNLGYKYIVIDDCWSERKRDQNNRLVPDKKRFPRGMKFLADYIHRKGLKFGMYSNPGNKTCMGYPGSYGHFDIDAQTFKDWDVDYVKFDGCFQTLDFLNTAYIDFGKSLNKTGRPMVYSCSWPYYVEHIHKSQPNYAAIMKTCNMWRNYHDVFRHFNYVYSTVQYYEYNMRTFSKYHGPGHWNDADMLLLGTWSLTENQSRVQLALWAIMSLPLLISCDMKSLDSYDKELLQNDQIIAINQDRLGLFPTLFKPIPNNNNVTIYLKKQHPIKGDEIYTYSMAVVNMNIHDHIVQVDLETFNLNNNREYHVMDCFDQKFIMNITKTQQLTLNVRAQDVILYTLFPL